MLFISLIKKNAVLEKKTLSAFRFLISSVYHLAVAAESKNHEYLSRAKCTLTLHVWRVTVFAVLGGCKVSF